MHPRQDGQSDKIFQVASDLSELHLRREIERMADEMGHEIAIYLKKYSIGIFDYDKGKLIYDGPYTLQQCHDKLREISGE